MEKYPQLVLRDWNRTICLLFPLVLLPAEADLAPKEKYSKKILVRALGSSSGKVIITLLIEVVAFYVKFTAVHVRATGF